MREISPGKMFLKNYTEPNIWKWNPTYYFKTKFISYFLPLWTPSMLSHCIISVLESFLPTFLCTPNTFFFLLFTHRYYNFTAVCYNPFGKVPKKEKFDTISVQLILILTAVQLWVPCHKWKSSLGISSVDGNAKASDNKDAHVISL